MHRSVAGLGLAVLIAGLASIVPAAAVERAALVEQLRANCFSNHANDAPSEKGKCQCFAQAFVDSLTPGEFAVPRQSAAINAKLAAARHICHFGDE